jgi:AMMECR1 domain-containing protein
LVIDAGFARAIFLPAVWEHIANPDEFLDRLMFKAGLRPDAWPPTMRAFRYTAFEFGADFLAAAGI